MKKIILVFVLSLLFLSSCSSSKKRGQARDSSDLGLTPNAFNLNQVLIFTDNSGNFSIKRSMKNSKGKLLFQRMIYQEDFSKFLERSRSVSIFDPEAVEEKRLRPVVSQYKGWFDGVEYSNQIKLSYSKREVEILTETKDKKYAASQKFSLPPENKKLCFFNMIPECIKLWGIPQQIGQSKNFETWFYVVMDAYPFIDLQYNDVSNKWITEATLIYDGMKDKEHQFSLEFQGQAIALKFNEKWDFVALYWVSQGVSMVTN